MSTDNKELNFSEKAFVNVTSDREAHPKRWIAILVQTCTEKKVGQRLDKLGIENYIPTQIEVHQWSDRKKKIERVVIPMVVFVKADNETEKTLRTYSFVYKFVSYPGQRTAATIPHEQIEKLKFMLDHAESKVEINDLTFEIGEEIEIVRGPLKGFCGELYYFEKEKPMIGIHIELLGYACVDINKADVKSKNK
ncbi:UpxY family transcription antiterminator [Parabacteroides pacaensis]|uniref:UpxY family transcription antiterminator n=1 Tax=Parabacteroides pacaensis TaxID=2086575 RepID=UPI00131B2230|nr:UpxY family transcription antiterminator [Parabacteroides pacaensis]